MGLVSAICFSVAFCLAGPLEAQDRPDPITNATPAPAPAPIVPTSPTEPISPVITPAPPNPSESEHSDPGKPSETPAQIIDVTSKPTAVTTGKAKWGEGFAALMAAATKLKAAVEKAGLKSVGHPLAVFTQTDDDGFSYEAMLPLTEKPEGKTELSDTVKLASSPAGKAIKFQHHGPYDDIDTTYDIITAYLDEKGLEAQDYFVEEYMTDLKSADDPNLAVDIYVFIKIK
jgi:effector-binding domain-containing protein